MTTNLRIGMGMSRNETSALQRLNVTVEMAIKGFMNDTNPFDFLFENVHKSMMIQRNGKGDMQWVVCTEEEITQKLSFEAMNKILKADKEGINIHRFCTPNDNIIELTKLLSVDSLKEIIEISREERSKREKSKFDPSKPFQVKDRGEWKTPKKGVLYVKQTRDGRHALENPDGRIVQVSHIRNVPENSNNANNFRFLNISIGHGKMIVIPIPMNGKEEKE